MDQVQRIHMASDGAAVTTGRSGLTLLELIICVAILTTVMMAAFSQILPLSAWRQTTRDRNTAMSLAKTMAERLQGGSWHRLGRRDAPWSWHRREDPLAVNDPLTEDAADPDNDLRVLGFLTEPSGMTNLEVFLEYYDMTIMDSTATHTAWELNRQDPAFILDESPDVLDLSEVTDAVVFRVLVQWQDPGGAPQRHEISLARRR